MKRTHRPKIRCKWQAQVEWKIGEVKRKKKRKKKSENHKQRIETFLHPFTQFLIRKIHLGVRVDVL